MNLPTTWRKLVAARLARAATRPARLRVEFLEPRETPAGLIAVGSEVGEDALLTAFDATTFAQRFSVNPYPGFTGGVNAAVGDVDGDGTADVVTGPGAGGGPTVNVYSGADGTLLRSLTVGDPDARNGASVGTADYDRDGRADLVVGTTAGGAPQVQVLRFADGAVLRRYSPFEGSGGSVSVAAADLTGDGVPDTAVGAGVGFAPRVTVFDGATDQVVMNVFAFEESFTGGVRVSAGTAGGAPVVLVAAGPTGGPRVQGQIAPTGQAVLNFFAYDAGTRAGVRAGLMDVDRDGDLDIVTAGGPGQPRDLRGFDVRNLAGLSVPSAFPGLPVAAAFDITAPTATLTTAAADPTRTTPLAFTATFSEPVNGFTAADLSVANGAVSNFVAVDGRTFTFNVTPAAAGAVTVSVAAGAATDAAGNDSAAPAAVTRTFDTTAPTATVNPLTTNDTTPTVTGTVSESGAAVTVTVGGQTVAATVTGTTFAATVPAALAEGTYPVTVTATDAAGNAGTSTAAGALVVDTTAPATTVTSDAPDPTNDAPIPFTVAFSEDVTGFTATDVTVTNGTASNFTAVDARTFTVDVTPAGQGAVTVAVPAGAATDAAGNGSTAAAAVARTFDTVAPTATANALTTNDATPTITGTVNDPDATITVTVGGQTVTATVTGSTFSATVPTALAEGTYDIAVSATDDAGNTGSATRTGGLVIDLTAPTGTAATTAADPTNLGAIPFTVTFDEAVTGFASTDVTVTNGAVTNFVAGADGRTFSFDVTPAADGAVAVSVAAGVATDIAGNPNAAAAEVSVTSDRTPPAATLTTNAQDPTAVSPIPVTVTFDEDVTGFDAADVAVANGAVVNFVAVDARTYTFDVVPTAAGTVAVAVAAGAAVDDAGNPSTAPTPLAVTFTGTVTSPTIATTATDPTNLDVIPFTVTFDDDVTEFDDTDITVTNGTLSNFVMVDARTFTFDVAPTADGDVTVDIAAAAATDTGGRPTAAATFSIVSDRTAPTTTVNAQTTNNTTPTITGTVSEAGSTVTVTVGGQTVTATVTETTFTATLATPLAGGTYDIVVTATDAAGNTASATLTGGLVIDTTPPTPTVTTSALDPTNLAVIPFTVTFDEDVSGFDEADISVTNGTVSNFVAGDARTFTFDVAPAGDGLVTVDLAAGAAQDLVGNDSVAASASVTSERFDPTAVVTTTAGAATNASPIPFTVTFSEDVTGFTDAGLAVTNGTASNFVAVDARTFTFDVTPAGEGTVTVAVAAGAAQDLFGNTNPASAAAAVEYDITGPTPTVSTTAADPTNLDAIPFAVVFDEDATDFVEADITVVNGTVTNFVAVDARTYTFDVTPDGDGVVTVSVAAGVATDALGNPSPASAPVTVTSDRDAPGVAGVTVDAAATPDGAYTVGAVIDILVTFAEAVVVDTAGGTPTLALNSGGTATYLGGSGTTALTFRYVVGAGDDAADLDYASAAALAPNGGAIADTAGNPADLTLPAPGGFGSLGAARDIRVDTTGPTGTIDAASVGAVTGTAADANSGVAAVTVSIFDPVSMLYFDGVGFTSATEVFLAATDTSGAGTFATWSFTIAAGTYDVRAVVADAAGNETTLGPTTVTVS
ncbi:MAG: FG-GAP-like repeat-containing protein [Gemmataceae bacterium]|nr:FG-GAP-like repeat-containing protein [Gemmataceae bacterium]